MNTTLYPGIPFSPQAQLTNNIGAADTIIEVSDVSAFPPAPNLATIGTDEEGETILYTAKTETALSGCQRGVEGEARGWTAGELIGRNFTAKDHADLIAAATEAYGAAEAAQEAAAAAGSVAATKQPKLTGQAGQVVGFAADGAAVAVPGWSNQNLLINSDFRNPVNRIGKTEYTGAGYTIDRFILQSVSGEASIKIGDRCVKLYAKDNDGLHQILEPGVLLCNTNYTCSILTKDGDLLTTSFISPAPGTTGGNTINYPGTIWMLFIWFSENDQTCHVWPVITYNQDSVKEIDIVAMKLEIGSQQTLAHQDADGNWVLNDPPNYDLQYALCSLYSPSTGEWVGNQHSNPNLLDNWYFADPINQRGQTEYTSQRVQQYTIDRWISAGDTAATWGLYLEDGGIRLSKGSAFQQKMDKAPPDGTVLTFSALIDWVVYSITFTWNSSTGYQRTNLPNGFALSWNGLNGYTQIFNPNGTGSEIVQAAKLELGPVQTLAHQDADGNWVLNDPPPNKALELAKCQRYQYRLSTPCISVPHYCTLDTLLFKVELPTTMRNNPTFVFYEGALAVQTMAAAEQTGFVFSSIDSRPNFIHIKAVKKSHGLTADNARLVINGFAMVDANL